LSKEQKLIELIEVTKQSGNRELRIKAMEALKELRATAAQQPAMTGAIAGTFDPSEGMSAGEAALIGIGSGFTRAGQGIKNLFALLGDDAQKARAATETRDARTAIAPLKERFPVATGFGEIVGETAATLPLGFGAGKLGAKAGQMAGSQALARYGAAALGGGVEGAIIGAADEQAGLGSAVGAGSAVALEAVLPRLGRVVRRYLNRQVTSQDIGTQDAINRLRQEMRQRGASPAEIAEAMDEVSRIGDIPEGASPAQVARRADFEAENIPIAGRSRITQNADDFSVENQLARQRNSAEADEFRALIYREDEAIESRARELATRLGEDQNDAAIVQRALRDLKTDIGTRKRAAYRELEELIQREPEAADLVPMPKARIVQAVDKVQNGAIRADKTTSDALDGLLAKYGMLGDEVFEGPRYSEAVFFDESGEKVIDKIKFRGKQKRFDLGSAETFRQDLNNIFDVTDPRQAAAKREVMEAYEGIVDELVENIPDAAPEQIRRTARAARRIAAEEKDIFTPERLIGRLTKKAKNGSNLIEASRVYETIRKAPPEDLQRLLSGLRREGVENGSGAEAYLKMAAMVDFTETAIKNAKKISLDGMSRREFSGTNFRKAVDRFGREKARLLFGDDFRFIERLERISESRISPDLGVQKGSADDLINRMIKTFARLANTPGIRQGVDLASGTIGEAIQEGQQRRAFRSAMDLTPTVEQVHDYIVYSAPRMAAYLGIVAPASSTITTVNE